MMALHKHIGFLYNFYTFYVNDFKMKGAKIFFLDKVFRNFCTFYSIKSVSASIVINLYIYENKNA